jgi:CxxC motif-containing protein (DUF1111 family)
MKGLHLGWYLLIGMVALAPAGVRMATWSRHREQIVEPQAVQAGQTLFLHEWTAHDPMSAGGDGLGPVYNASSCVECHHQGGPGGGGELPFNVTTYVYRSDAVAAAHQLPREGVVHANAVNCPPETLNQLHTSLPQVSQPTLSQLVVLSGNSSSQSNHCIRVPSDVRLSQRNTPALFGARLIDAIPDRVIIANENKERLSWGLASATSEDKPIGRALRLADGRIGHFGWKAQSSSLASFVQAACANELGLGNPGQAQPRPISNLSYPPSDYDLTLEQCDQITAFVASLPRPIEKLPDDSSLRSEASEGKQLFHHIGCADCHMPNVGKVEGLYSDLLLHDMGQPLEGGGSYNDVPQPSRPNTPPKPNDGPQPGEWRTPPLWGVADSAPYLHDGRAKTLQDAIEQHGGQGNLAARKFDALGTTGRAKVVAFLQTLRAP